jgi:monofunctional glycosyltransferase
MYLNVAQMGEGVFGIEAAAQLYFGVPASKLTPEQAALIAAALPGPRLYNIAKPGPWLRKHRDWVLSQMRYVEDDPDVRALLRDRRPD